MNDLNSVLLEGAVTNGPVFNNNPKLGASCDFTITSNRFYKKNDNLEEEQSTFQVRTHGHLAEVCSEYLSVGRRVRIVGRLRQESGSVLIVIVAEHVEFKPRLPRAE